MNFGKILRDTLTIKFDKAFGLDIGDRSVEIIELEKVFKFSIVTYGRIELEAGIVENGKILNQNALAEKVKSLLKEAKPKKVSTNKVVLSLPESQVFTMCFEVEASLKFSALSQVIMEKVVLAMPISIDKTYWDFIEKPLSDKTKKLIMFFCVPKDVANSYMKFCSSIGLEAVSLSIESWSLARVILKNSSKHSLIMDIGSRVTNLSFYDSNDKINMSATIPIAGELPLIEDILRETQEAIYYYEKTFKQKLDNVYLVGGSALLPGIVETIKNRLNREVTVATSAYDIDLRLLIDKNNFPLFANVLGLGMLGTTREFKDVNLLKKIPSAEINSVDRLNLYKLGYLSRMNIFRRILTNRYISIVLLVLVGITIAIIFQQVQDYNAVKNLKVDTNIVPLKPSLSIETGTSTSPISVPIVSTTSTSSAVTHIGMSTNNITPATSSGLSSNYIFDEDKNPGSYGEPVSRLQERLTAENYYNGLVGGFFGPATEQALRAYQLDKGLTVTGILDALTRAKLNGK